MALLTSSSITESYQSVSKRKKKESSLIHLLCRPLLAAPFLICPLARRRCYKGDSGSDETGSYRYAFRLVFLLFRL